MTARAIIASDISALQTWVPIGTATPSAAAAVTFTGLSAYRALRLTLFNVAPATDGVDLYLRTSTDNGATYDSGAGAYGYTSTQNISSGSPFIGVSSTSDTKVILGDVVGNDVQEAIGGVMHLLDFNQTKYMRGVFSGYRVGSNGAFVSMSAGMQRFNTTARNALQLLFSSGNIASGYVVLEGMA